MVLLAAIIAMALSAAHVMAGQLRFVDVAPRSRWLSSAGGVSVAYVFIHILPDLAQQQQAVGPFLKPFAGYLEHHVYLVSLLGLMSFYGLERLSKQSRNHSRERYTEDVTTPGVFWVHTVAFALYNALIGYLLLHREEGGWASLLFFSIAMGTHFVINDHGLRHDHKHRYHHYGRWILSAAVLGGFTIGLFTQVHRLVIAMFFAFLAGGVVLNVLKEELPAERRSNFTAFALGAILYTALLLLV